MADRYTTVEANIVNILTANVADASKYDIRSSMSRSTNVTTAIYMVNVIWTRFGNELESGTTCYEADREYISITCTPRAGVNDQTAKEQANIMTEEFVEILRDSSLVKNSTLDSSGDYVLTEMRVESASKGRLNNSFGVLIIFSYLRDSQP